MLYTFIVILYFIFFEKGEKKRTKMILKIKLIQQNKRKMLLIPKNKGYKQS